MRETSVNVPFVYKTNSVMDCEYHHWKKKENQKTLVLMRIVLFFVSDGMV